MRKTESLTLGGLMCLRGAGQTRSRTHDKQSVKRSGNWYILSIEKSLLFPWTAFQRLSARSKLPSITSFSQEDSCSVLPACMVGQVCLYYLCACRNVRHSHCSCWPGKMSRAEICMKRVLCLLLDTYKCKWSFFYEERHIGQFFQMHRFKWHLLTSSARSQPLLEYTPLKKRHQVCN